MLMKNSIALVLLDINMPGKSGAELLPHVRATYPDIAIIMAIAISDIGIVVQCMKQRVYGYITKPFNLDEVALSVGIRISSGRRG
jgi:putative two-component system response regulator